MFVVPLSSMRVLASNERTCIAQGVNRSRLNAAGYVSYPRRLSSPHSYGTHYPQWIPAYETRSSAAL